ncbi:MAG: hypothetical protein MUO43_16480 [Desulfobacterales bacterium]|nr:hypothetical protein [Desulfobacterales bacterium]
MKSSRGKIEVKVQATRRVPEGVIFIPSHFTESPADALANSAFDPVAKIPEYKVSAV